MRPSLTRRGEALAVSLSGIGKTAFEQALPMVKAIEGRRFNPETKLWEFPLDPMIAHRLIHQVGAEPAIDVLGWMREELAKQADEVTTQLPAPAAPEDFVSRATGIPALLFPHQRQAVEFITAHRRVLVADDMGLGKTLEAIAAVVESGANSKGPKLVIAPASMAGKWEDELLHGPRSQDGEPLLETWDVGLVVRIPGRILATKRRKLLEDGIQAGAWIVTTWEQIRAQKGLTGKAKPKYAWMMKEPLYAETDWVAVIADEAHRAKNRHAQQTRGLWQLHALIQLALTGTPILNSPDEIWSLLVWLYPEVYGEYHRDKIGYERFYQSYVEYSEGRFGKIVTGVKNADALRFELANLLVRRTKRQVLPDLPVKFRTRVPVEMTPKQRALYEDAEKGLMFELELALKGANREKIAAALEAGDLQRVWVLVPNAAARMTRLRQILETPALLGGVDESAKLDAAVEMIVDNSGRPFVVFTKFRGTTTILQERLERHKPLKGRVAVIHGDVTPEQRTAFVADFQVGNLDVLVATIEAGGVGLTLTRAQDAIFISREWTPAVNEQAEDRLHRIGQTGNVNIRLLEVAGSIDTERIAEKLRLKELIVAALVTQDTIETRTAA